MSRSVRFDDIAKANPNVRNGKATDSGGNGKYYKLAEDFVHVGELDKEGNRRIYSNLGLKTFKKSKSNPKEKEDYEAFVYGVRAKINWERHYSYLFDRYFSVPIACVEKEDRIVGVMISNAPEEFYFSYEGEKHLRKFENVATGMLPPDEKWTDEEKCYVLYHLAVAYNVLHKWGYVFGDISDGNCAISKDKERPVFIYDSDSIALTGSKRIMKNGWTPPYCAPEEKKAVEEKATELLQTRETDVWKFAVQVLRMYVTSAPEVARMFDVFEVEQESLYKVIGEKLKQSLRDEPSERGGMGQWVAVLRDYLVKTNKYTSDQLDVDKKEERIRTKYPREYQSTRAEKLETHTEADHTENRVANGDVKKDEQASTKASLNDSDKSKVTPKQVQELAAKLDDLVARTDAIEQQRKAATSRDKHVSSVDDFINSMLTGQDTATIARPKVSPGQSKVEAAISAKPFGSTATAAKPATANPVKLADSQPKAQQQTNVKKIAKDSNYLFKGRTLIGKAMSLVICLLMLAGGGMDASLGYLQANGLTNHDSSFFSTTRKLSAGDCIKNNSVDLSVAAAHTRIREVDCNSSEAQSVLESPNSRTCTDLNCSEVTIKNEKFWLRPLLGVNDCIAEAKNKYGSTVYSAVNRCDSLPQVADSLVKTLPESTRSTIKSVDYYRRSDTATSEMCQSQNEKPYKTEWKDMKKMDPNTGSACMQFIRTVTVS